MATPVTRIFHAHSTSNADETDWQTLPDHLNAVGKLAGQAAKHFGATVLAETAGKLHDLGKYTDAYQQRIRGGQRVDHATWGAKVASEKYGALGRMMAYGIAGHHAGLANGRDPGTRTSLDGRLAAELPPLFNDYLKDLTLPATPREMAPTTWHKNADRLQFQMSLLTRMIFSCVVDGDYLDTDRFYSKIENRPLDRDTPKPTLIELRAKLDAHLGTFKVEKPIDITRAQILTHARSHTNDRVGMFSLTVPTGGGKTLTSLAFALDHAIAHGLDRVIFVIPFTSIVEQNAAVFKKAFGDLGDAAVLEHHSAFVPTPGKNPEAAAKLRVVMDNWDAPIIVTTSVQFFESLYSSKPSQCRKLHNITGSVVILDEAQALPLKLLRPCVAVLDELALNYRTSVALCTATQPALNAPKFAGGFKDVIELAPDPEALFETLARVTIVSAGTLDDDALTQRMRHHEQALAIVNNRRHAQALYVSIADEEGARHLSTLMYPKHRTRVLSEVRETLKRENPCRLISTSLIEAGVDIDFPYVLRAEAGLDSIAQAAGRCNRSGKRSRAESIVEVFSTANPDWAPPKALMPLADKAREIMRAAKADPLSIAAINEYFGALYWQIGADKLDGCNLLGTIEADGIAAFKFELVDQQFQMIESVQMPVIIPADGECKALLRDLEHTESCGGIARKLQPYLIQIPRNAHDALAASGAIQPVAPDKYGTQFMQLITMHLYNDRFGLQLDGTMLLDPDSLIQ
ncbi:CRISPR-associated endonuclease Cas3'' [uncultured Caballeronia sp.]|uniref:CRISPR-associated endonuclease Cas3'' n=1 Tax=uncultured Caballeronia sp. TaxID=1827198 RepID=UPI0035CCA7C9